jgi:dUTP pyrophosphatase
MKIQIVNKSKHPLPKHETKHAAAVDIMANSNKPVMLGPLGRAIIPTGLYFALPPGYEAQIRPRSGLSIKHGISIVNTPGTIDADYRGELKILVINLSNESYTIHDGDRIAQMVVAKYEAVEWQVMDKLDDTERDTGGLGSTGR